MTDNPLPVSDLYARLQHELGIGEPQHPLSIEVRGGVAVLKGEVEDIATKRRVARTAREMLGGKGVDDRITVSVAEGREDGAISVRLSQTLMDEAVFHRFSLNLWRKDEMHMIRDIRTRAEGHLDIVVDEGVVTLSGEVWSLSHSRMAELLAWWTPGVRSVINRIAILPEERDNDDEITDAVRIALEKDPLVKNEQIRITTRDRVVILEGLVRTLEEKEMAEHDVWYVGSGVAGVSNQLEVEGP